MSFPIRGRVAELVYAVDLKSAGLTALRVRVPPRPPTKNSHPWMTVFSSVAMLGLEPKVEYCQWQYEGS